MSKEKDPAFLFYSKDWIEGTAEMLPIEKGVYIDLLAHQHQKKSLPIEMNRLCRLVGMSEIEFLSVWENIKSKFVIENDRIVNRKLNQVMTERSDKGHKNKIIGIFASLLRLEDLPKKQYLEVRKLFKVEEFIPIPNEQLTERLTEWFKNALKTIENGNGDENANNLLKEKFNNFIIWLNSELKKSFKFDKTAFGQFSARSKDGYNNEHYKKALSEIKKDKYHIDSNFKYITPEFLTRSAQLEKWFNSESKSKPSEKYNPR